MIPLGAVLTALALWLAPTGSIRGTVLDTANCTGVARVSVRLQSTGRVVLTDDDGGFAFEDVEPG